MPLNGNPKPCTAHARNGDTCTQPAIKGATVCKMHGGSAPQVKDAARRRLWELIDPVLTRLFDIALKEEDPRVALVAIRDVLDRAGLTEPKRVEVITIDMIEAETARLETELGVNDPIPE